MMKSRSYLSVVLLLCLSAFFVAGCTSNSGMLKNANADWSLSDTQPKAITEWPENKFTAQIEQPKTGTPDTVYDCSDSGRYAVFLKDFTMDAATEYVTALKKQGYTELSAGQNTVSGGILLQKSNVLLNISYSQTTLGILITMENNS